MKIEEIIGRYEKISAYRSYINLIYLGINSSVLAATIILGVAGTRGNPLFEKNPYSDSIQSSEYQRERGRIESLYYKKRKLKERGENKKIEKINLELIDIKEYLEKEKNKPEVRRFIKWEDDKKDEASRISYFAAPLVGIILGLTVLGEKIKTKLKLLEDSL